MAINQNHQFEDLEGVKCAIVERNVSPARAEFLKDLLEFNGYKVIVVNSPPPKGSPPPEENTGAPQLLTIGVTDVTFNATNAIFGRLMKTKNGKTLTLAYWQQKEQSPSDDVPYFY